ncbi:peptidyl-tRNA hydrolase domain-containing protein [Toxoplasma gondii TgCatPRC2]|uniref:Peptidyl-tRNA hydrolase domain-containing protein n=1 Tax=Toxoplasma gondii TgCatPRC2 TaxID=1130821 RepID=A0A151H7Q4_TOXGO|nr:peptidyl-tRNA hydrolase domain-containing protein [Toxoplasma gondii TgCatPRC2]
MLGLCRRFASLREVRNIWREDATKEGDRISRRHCRHMRLHMQNPASLSPSSPFSSLSPSFSPSFSPSYLPRQARTSSPFVSGELPLSDPWPSLSFCPHSWLPPLSFSRSASSPLRPSSPSVSLSSSFRSVSTRSQSRSFPSLLSSSRAVAVSPRSSVFSRTPSWTLQRERRQFSSSPSLPSSLLSVRLHLASSCPHSRPRRSLSTRTGAADLPRERLTAGDVHLLEALLRTVRQEKLSLPAEQSQATSADAVSVPEAGALLATRTGARWCTDTSGARGSGGSRPTHRAQFQLLASIFSEALLSSLEAFLESRKEKEVLTQLLVDSHEALCSKRGASEEELGESEGNACSSSFSGRGDPTGLAVLAEREKEEAKSGEPRESSSRLQSRATEDLEEEIPAFLTDDPDWVAAHLEACRNEELFLADFYLRRGTLRQGLAQVREACSAPAREKEKKNAQEEKRDKSMIFDPENDEQALQGDAVLEIQAGVGGEDAALFSRDLLGMYEAFSLARGWVFRVLDIQETEKGGYRRASAQVEGPDAFRLLSLEAGIHRVQRVPPTEARGRMQTSATAVTVLPRSGNLEDKIDLSPPTLKIDFMRASGPGGQSVNKSETAVRITHKPTGVSVHCMRTQSQMENKSLALELLRAQLLQQLMRQASEERGRALDAQKGSKDRSEKIRTYNFQRDVVTDHRCRMHVNGVEEFLDSSDGLFEIHEVLKRQREDMQLAGLLEEIRSTLAMLGTSRDCR